MTTRPVAAANAVGAIASRGQILVLFALVLVALLGVLGLAVDLGMAFAQRRTMQNAADAGALAGARFVAKATADSLTSAQTEVETVVRANAMDYGTITDIDCTYVDDDGGSLGSCTIPIPLGATGVEVAVTEEHPTVFIQIVPGAPASVTTGAQASAHVKRLAAPRDGPFLPCALGTQLASGGTMDIMVEVDGRWILNPLAIGQTFKIHGPQIEKCKAKASRFKGLADTASNRSKTAPNWFNYKEGDSAGTISEDVEGPNGCKAGQEINNCVVFLPIALDDPAEEGNDKQLWVVAFAPFYVTTPKSNEHHGTLLADYMTYGRGQAGDWGWYQSYDGPIAIRLTD